MAEIDYTGKQLAGYRVLRKLGQGGMATVYKAHEDSLNRVVALKVIGSHLSEQAQFIERFKREAQAAAQLSHPNIVQVYAIGEENGVHFFAMEYVKGRSLREIIEGEGFLTAGRAVPILEQVSEALAVAHEAGIVHRDIKPANIMVDDAGRARVADFGIAQMVTQERLTQSGMMIGTPEYISPEQCRGEKLDGRSDIYALGVTFFQMLSGRTPFQADTPAELVLQIIEGPSFTVGEFNPTVPPGIQAIVEKMMCVDPSARFQSAEDLLHALRNVDTEPSTTTVQMAKGAAAPGPPPATPEPEPTKRLSRDDSTPAPPATVVAPPESLETELLAADSSPEPPAATEVAPAATEVHSAAAAVETAAATEPDGPGKASPAADPTPAASAYSGSDENGSRSLMPIAATVVVLVALAFMAWQFWPRGGVDDDATSTGNETLAADGTADAQGEQQTQDPEAGAAPLGDAGVGEEPSATAPNDDDSSSSTDDPSAAAGNVQAGGPDEPAAQEAESGGAAPQQPALAAIDNSAAANAEPPPPAEPEFIAPPINSVVAETSGEYEYVDLVNSWIEGVLSDQSFEIVDYPSSPYNTIQEAARFHVVATAKLVSIRDLEYFGRIQQQYTVALTLRITDLADGVTVAGPDTETIEYTDVNLREKLESGTNNLARRLARELRRKIQVP